MLELGHQKEGYGLAWSPLREWHLLSGSDDCQVCFWDLRDAGRTVSKKGESVSVQATAIRTGHTSVVEDVQWHHHNEQLFGSVGDDKQILIWDLRDKADVTASAVPEAHSKDINCISFSPYDPFLFATGSSDTTVKLWDMRNLKDSLHELRGHTKEVYQVHWAPFNETVRLLHPTLARRIGALRVFDCLIRPRPTRRYWGHVVPIGGFMCGTSAGSARSRRWRTPRTVRRSCCSFMAATRRRFPSLAGVQKNIGLSRRCRRTISYRYKAVEIAPYLDEQPQTSSFFEPRMPMTTHNSSLCTPHPPPPPRSLVQLGIQFSYLVLLVR